MITLSINGKQVSYRGNGDVSLLHFLRNDLSITSPKDGCSGEGSCGACTVEINGLAKLACRTKMEGLSGAEVTTTEGMPSELRLLLGSMFAEKGAVQCGFCSPGFIMRAKKLFASATMPSRDDIIRHINPNICRCTGYIKIVDAIEVSLKSFFDEKNHKDTGPEASVKDAGEQPASPSATIGNAYPKYQAVDTALGNRPFVDDMFVERMHFGALKFSEHPRALVKKIDDSEAKQLPGVVRVFTATDIPGAQVTGLIVQDWPLMIAEGQHTNCIGDVVAGVVAVTEETARKALDLIRVEYEVLEAVTDMHAAVKPGSINVHAGKSNILETCSIRFGDVEDAFKQAAFTSSSVYTTQRIEHAFLETECALALPEEQGLRLYSQGQGVYVDRKLIAHILAIDEDRLKVTQVQNGGGFGGKEDLSVQGHACLFSYLLNLPVKVKLTRQESMRMHPKRHPVWMDMHLACDAGGKLTAIRLNAIGDTGAYASVGTKVMERVVGHATGAYTLPSVDIQAHTVYTNNIPSGAMRGFGVPQVVFALESCIDDLCRQGGFDRWEFRYNNALEDGAATATGQKLEGVGLKKTLLAVKEDFRKARHAGIACGIKNTGVGNGMIDDSEVKIEFVSEKKIIIHHGWTEMGQGIHTMAIQCLHEETGIEPSIMEVNVSTESGIPTGMTTSSRATALLGNAIIDAAKRINEELERAGGSLKELTGRTFKGKYLCNWTCKPGAETDDPKIHFAYGYATQVVILDDEGNISKVIAAHDAGKIMNRMLFEGQIEGAVHMGLGYALSENLSMKDGQLLTSKFKDLGILRAKQMPPVEVIGIEETDPYGPYGAKGIGEIGMVPTAAAVANAYYAFDGKKRCNLPLDL
ncbi:MAG: selenium-dependent xanthine dehydrogenase [Bacteroidales bacterium]|nr:selenium-dependent xanthine dehydrogenase [Bacteroidales bacterium]